MADFSLDSLSARKPLAFAGGALTGAALGVTTWWAINSFVGERWNSSALGILAAPPATQSFPSRGAGDDPAEELLPTWRGPSSRAEEVMDAYFETPEGKLLTPPERANVLGQLAAVKEALHSGPFLIAIVGSDGQLETSENLTGYLMAAVEGRTSGTPGVPTTMNAQTIAAALATAGFDPVGYKGSILRVCNSHGLPNPFDGTNVVAVDPHTIAALLSPSVLELVAQPDAVKKLAVQLIKDMQQPTNGWASVGPRKYPSILTVEQDGRTIKLRPEDKAALQLIYVQQDNQQPTIDETSGFVPTATTLRLAALINSMPPESASEVPRG